MPQVTSPLSAPAGMPLVNAAHLSKAGGLFMIFGTAADLAAAVAAEGASWPDGQRLALSVEADSGAERIYRASLGHARTAKIGPFVRVLPGDANIVRATSGVPAAGIGANGDLAFDPAVGTVYERPSGTWALLTSIYNSTPSVSLPGAPGSVVATPGNGSVSGTWAAPASNGGAPITHYRLTWSGGQTATVGNVLSGSVPGVTNGTPGTLRVAASNDGGLTFGPQSAVSNSVTPSAPVAGAPVLALNGMPLTLNGFQLVMV